MPLIYVMTTVVPARVFSQSHRFNIPPKRELLRTVVKRDRLGTAGNGEGSEEPVAAVRKYKQLHELYSTSAIPAFSRIPVTELLKLVCFLMEATRQEIRRTLPTKITTN